MVMSSLAAIGIAIGPRCLRGENRGGDDGLNMQIDGVRVVLTELIENARNGRNVR
jgi:hypothetical protein